VGFYFVLRLSNTLDAGGGTPTTSLTFTDDGTPIGPAAPAPASGSTGSGQTPLVPVEGAGTSLCVMVAMSCAHVTCRFLLTDPFSGGEGSAGPSGDRRLWTWHGFTESGEAGQDGSPSSTAAPVPSDPPPSTYSSMRFDAGAGGRGGDIPTATASPRGAPPPPIAAMTEAILTERFSRYWVADGRSIFFGYVRAFIHICWIRQG
jgi:hypothetical protein